MLNYGMKTDLSEAQEGCGKMAWIETPAEKFRRRCQEKEDELIRLGYEEDDTISGDMMRDE